MDNSHLVYHRRVTMPSRSYNPNNNNRITVVQNLAEAIQEPRKSLAEYIADLYNKLTIVNHFIEQSYKKVINIDQNISVMRLEDIAVLRLLSKNIFSFKIEQLIAYDYNHIVLYVRTKDSFYRYDVKKDDWINIDEKQIDNEKDFYCMMHQDLLDFVSKVKEENIDQQTKERINTVGQICKSLSSRE